MREPIRLPPGFLIFAEYITFHVQVMDPPNSQSPLFNLLASTSLKLPSAPSFATSAPPLKGSECLTISAIEKLDSQIIQMRYIQNLNSWAWWASDLALFAPVRRIGGAKGR
jgi:hypothetical protein